MPWHALSTCQRALHTPRTLDVVPQGKMEPDARQALIAAGQQIKAQLEAVEAKLVQVRVR
jgi:hypothetical protein